MAFYILQYQINIISPDKVTNTKNKVWQKFKKEIRL